MYTVKRTGSMADVIRSARDIPARVIPYAASTAATRSAQAGQRAIEAAMPRVFDRPTAYTLNALRVVPATVDTLSARVAVKDIGGGVPQESYLLPEVEGGGRNEKRFERALRFAGFLKPGERAVPGAAAPLDAAGNLSSSTIRAILRELQAGKGRKRATYFAGPAGKRGRRGVWKRERGRLLPVLIFTRSLPQYRRALDFEALAEHAARETFPREFAAAAAAMQARRR